MCRVCGWRLVWSLAGLLVQALEARPRSNNHPANHLPLTPVLFSALRRCAVEEVRALHRDASSSASLELGPSSSSPHEAPLQLPLAPEGAAAAQQQLPSVPEGDAAQHLGGNVVQQQGQPQSRAGAAAGANTG